MTGLIRTRELKWIPLEPHIFRMETSFFPVFNPFSLSGNRLSSVLN